MLNASWEVFQQPVAAKLRDSSDLVLITKVNKKSNIYSSSRL